MYRALLYEYLILLIYDAVMNSICVEACFPLKKNNKFEIFIQTMGSGFDAGRYAWCLVVEHLYESAWNSYSEGGAVNANVRAALEEVVKVSWKK